jgi:hypothetical protein
MDAPTTPEFRIEVGILGAAGTGKRTMVRRFITRSMIDERLASVTLPYETPLDHNGIVFNTTVHSADLAVYLDIVVIRM